MSIKDVTFYIQIALALQLLMISTESIDKYFVNKYSKFQMTFFESSYSKTDDTLTANDVVED